KRIVELLEPKNDWTKEDFMKMILDSKSSIAPELVKIIVNNVTNNLSIDNEKEALDELKKWDGDFTKSSVGATVFTKFIYMYLKNTFEDEIGTTVFASFINTHVMYREISEQLKKEESIWWDNIKTTETKENKSQILSQSFSETVATLENQLGNDVNSWTWNRVHTVTHKHPLGTLKALDFLFNLNIGPYEINGSNRVINKQGFDISNTPVNDVKSGPSTRRIVDFSDIENSMSILPTGNSGNPFSEFYRDQAEMFVNGEFRKMKLNKEEIEKVSTKLIFTPKKD
ncbi:MAG: penicillin amidase, partial [Flavobacteriales bacterium]